MVNVKINLEFVYQKICKITCEYMVKGVILKIIYLLYYMLEKKNIFIILLIIFIICIYNIVLGKCFCVNSFKVEDSCSNAACNAPDQNCIYDESCKNGGLGCNAGGSGNCRFCGFGGYIDNKCNECNENGEISYNSDCYKLLTGVDSLKSIKNEHLLAEITYKSNTKKVVYVDLPKRHPFKEMLKVLLLEDPNNIWSGIIVEIVGVLAMLATAQPQFPIPIGFYNMDTDICLFGVSIIKTKVNNLFIPGLTEMGYNGGAVLKFQYEGNPQLVSIVDDFNFKYIDYKDAIFDKNKSGYNGYIIDPTEFNKMNNKYENKKYTIDNDPDVSVKFYIKIKFV